MPETDLASIHRFCEQRSDVSAASTVRLEAEVDARAVTIVERRAPWRGGGEWTADPIARLRFTATSRTWTLYWPDRNGRWHNYDGASSTTDVTDLLAEIERDPTNIFWG